MFHILGQTVQYICNMPFVLHNKDVINIDKSSTIFFDFEVSGVILLWRVCESCDNLPDPRATNISRSKKDDHNMNILLLSMDKPVN